ncbi:D-alpha,beta-D-heptose 1,7-bisphosphate phosphatase [Marinobacter persicus]|uniref:D,D-heptose 1,7-bisphosphate phosphatase n=1 Tax=Marinobacter persicus TaxID=930118 RepID=A0A1I3X8I2_9GAMM|nr:D-glycero-beta-D-manno-heptose 1,7-bisphosphate 7-phosphatase [Marinobacter persicus]GHD48870.1 D,D-heptose 1,7-bisphosphate phosphatase [Marinobacter persicus]SFK16042.1 D-alpha,beta-D-heptose 1,7-bisphosphate phosphatase [Marinobacter persicus]
MSNKAVFLDRDGVINVDHGYVYRKEDFEFVDGIFEVCRHFQKQGYLLIVVTNQSGIARGMYTEADFQRLTEWMLERFREEGIEIAAVYHCPHHPKFGPEETRDCDCRKPKPGMILKAIEEFDIAPCRSIMLGDKSTDEEAGIRAGLGKNIKINDSSDIIKIIFSLPPKD